MTCKTCTNPAKPGSLKGLCAPCTKADDAAKSRERSRLQHLNRMKEKPPAPLCICCCGERTRSSIGKYFNRAHKAEHLKVLRAQARGEHPQPRQYVKPPASQRLMRTTKSERTASLAAVPVSETPEEKRKYAALLARAQKNRVLFQPNWRDD